MTLSTSPTVLPTVLPILFSTGYLGNRAPGGKPKLFTLKELVSQHDLTIADIRANPWSYVPDWRAHTLRDLFGDRYQQIRQLGNRNYKNGGEIEIINMAAGLTRLLVLSTQRPVLLLCACEHYDCCHRKVVIDGAMATGRFSAHLELDTWDNLAQLNTAIAQVRSASTHSIQESAQGGAYANR